MMMMRGFLSKKLSMMRRGFSTSMFASESDLLRELRGTKEGVKIELNDVLSTFLKRNASGFRRCLRTESSETMRMRIRHQDFCLRGRKE